MNFLHARWASPVREGGDLVDGFGGTGFSFGDGGGVEDGDDDEHGDGKGVVAMAFGRGST
jgi:hypothetical protein